MGRGLYWDRHGDWHGGVSGWGCMGTEVWPLSAILPPASLLSVTPTALPRMVACRRPLPLRQSDRVALVGTACDAPHSIDVDRSDWTAADYYVIGGSGRVVSDRAVSIRKVTHSPHPPTLQPSTPQPPPPSPTLPLTSSLIHPTLLPLSGIARASRLQDFISSYLSPTTWPQRSLCPIAPM